MIKRVVSMVLIFSLILTFGTVANAAGNIGASQKEFAERGINVKWFGAKGNGINDDTGAIQKAIDTASKTGGTVFLPNGNYLISNLTIPNMCNIKGEHRYKTVLKTKAASGSAIYFSGTGGEGRSKNRISISNFTLTSNGAGEAVDYGIKIDAYVGNDKVYPGFIEVNNIEVTGLQKSTVISFYMDDVSHLNMKSSIFSTKNGGTAFKIEGTNYNTGVFSFENVNFGNRLTDNYGMVIGKGAAIDSIIFNGCYFAGKIAAEKIGTGSNNVRSIIHNSSHYENSTNLAGNSLVEVAGEKGFGGVGLAWRNCSFGGFGVAEAGFKFGNGKHYGITIEDCEFVNIKSVGYIVNNGDAAFKDCLIKSPRTATTKPQLFQSQSFRDDGGWFGGWTIINDGFTDFQKGLKIGGARVIAVTAMPASGSFTEGDIAFNVGKSVEYGPAGSKYIIEGWKRITTGNSHILNKDWFQMRVFTGN